MTLDEIGKLIVARRETFGLKQDDLAEMAQVAIKTVYKVENGVGNPSIQTLTKILSILGLELNAQIRQVTP